MSGLYLDDGPCGCCARSRRGCTEGPSGPCCPCCSDTGREFWPYENQEAARVFADATLASADALEGALPLLMGTESVMLAKRQIRALRDSVVFVSEVRW